MSRPSTPTPLTLPGTTSTITTPMPLAPLPSAMTPSDHPRSSSNGCFVPILTKTNFLKWQVCVLAYLEPGDHAKVLERTYDVASHRWFDPVALTGVKELASWYHSERSACGIIVSTAIDLHLELVHKHRQGSLWALWLAIEAKHIKQDASFRHGAWMTFLGVRHGPSEPYMDFLNRISDARDQIDRVTPPGLTIDQRMDKLLLFTVLCGMRADDPLRRQLVSQKNICLDDVMASFIRTDQDTSITATLEATNAATAVRCFICHLLGHIAKDCPHADAINSLVTQRAGSSSNSNKQRF